MSSKQYFCLIVLIAFSAGTNATLPTDFSQAKRFARHVHADHRETFYCGCKYDKHNKIDLKSCGYKIQQDKRRARRLEWEHIVPVSAWGRNLPCWNEKICCSGKTCYKGRTCCRKQDPHFVKMEADLHNLVPEIGELNALRSNYPFEILPYILPGQFGTCEIKIDNKSRQVEPKKVLRGRIARAYLYMHKTYQVPLNDRQKSLYMAWNLEFPPDDWEIKRDQRIAHIQGNHNHYILEYQDD